MRINDSATEPVLLLIGSPMGALGFSTLAGHFGDRTVVTYDPRGSGRSRRTDGALETTPDEHADDLHRLIDALDAGPVDVFASSGGADRQWRSSSRSPATKARYLVIGVGAESRSAMAGRAAAAVAERLGTVPVTFPGGHDGFLGGEYGSTGEPEGFAAILREILAS